MSVLTEEDEEGETIMEVGREGRFVKLRRLLCRRDELAVVVESIDMTGVLETVEYLRF